MKNRFLKLFLAIVFLETFPFASARPAKWSLSGEWRFQTDVMDFLPRISFAQVQP